MVAGSNPVAPIHRKPALMAGFHPFLPSWLKVRNRLRVQTRYTTFLYRGPRNSRPRARRRTRGIGPARRRDSSRGGVQRWQTPDRSLYGEMLATRFHTGSSSHHPPDATTLRPLSSLRPKRVAPARIGAGQTIPWLTCRRSLVRVQVRPLKKWPKYRVFLRVRCFRLLDREMIGLRRGYRPGSSPGREAARRGATFTFCT